MAKNAKARASLLIHRKLRQIEPPREIIQQKLHHLLLNANVYGCLGEWLKPPESLPDTLWKASSGRQDIPELQIPPSWIQRLKTDLSETLLLHSTSEKPDFPNPASRNLFLPFPLRAG